MVCGSAAGFRNRNRIPFRPTDVCHVQSTFERESTEHYAVIDIGFPLGLRID